MRIVKPLRLMIMPRPYRWRNKKYLAVTMAAAILHDADKFSVLPEHFLVNDILPELDADEILDFVMPKPNPEFLVSGHAYTAHQHDKTKCMVSVAVGDIKKQGIVFGDRFLIDNTITEPLPFESMPLTWANSYGGPQFDDNPLGTGMQETQVGDGIKGLRLPNLESPTNQFHPRQALGKTFNFGQIRIDWPRRLKQMGTCTETWLSTVGSGFFDDMKASAFNAADDDQIWKNKTQLSMDESFEIWNMHPTEHCWSGKLPPLAARCFIQRRDAGSHLTEVAMRPTTVWFVPHRKNYVVLFHGNIEIGEDDAFDVTAIMGGLELSGQAREQGYYESIFDIRVNSEKAALHALKDEELIPESILEPWIEAARLDSHAMVEKAGKLQYQNSNFPGGFIGPIKPITLADAADLAERGNKLSDDFLQEQEQERLKALKQLDAPLQDGETESERQLVREINEGLDFFSNDPLKTPKIAQTGPPKIDMLQEAVGTKEDLAEIRKYRRSSGKDLRPMLEVKDLGKRSLRRMYLYSVQYQNGVARIGPHENDRVRDEVLKRYRRDKNLTEMDLTGADLSGMTLAGADFSQAWMENVDLSDTDLSDCCFTETVLARSTFTDTILDGAKLNKVNLSEAVFDRVSFKNTNFEALISETQTLFSNCVFENALFDDFNSQKLKFTNCSWRNAAIKNITFMWAVFSQCDWNNTELDKVNFEDCQFDTTTFSQCALSNCVAIDTTFTRLHLQECVVTKLTFTEQDRFDHCFFDHSHFRQSLFREVVFEQANFEHSIFEQCDFSLANLHQCRLRHIKTPQSMFVRANLDHADMTDSNLMFGNFQKSSFIGTNLTGCNFFRADMSETILDKSTVTENSYVKNTRLVPANEHATGLRSNQYE